VIVPIAVLLKDGTSESEIEAFAKFVDGTPNRELFQGSAYQDQVRMKSHRLCKLASKLFQHLCMCKGFRLS
jgi:hypothetical protein